MPPRDPSIQPISERATERRGFVSPTRGPLLGCLPATIFLSSSRPLGSWPRSCAPVSVGRTVDGTHARLTTATATVMVRRPAGSSLPVAPTHLPLIVSQLEVPAYAVPNHRANHTGPRSAARGARLKW